MSMHQGLDLSRFSKVSSDQHTTTLRHSKGHEIKVVHSALTPKMRDDLARLPAHMAEGGDVEDPAPSDPLNESRSVPDEPAPAAPMDAESPATAEDQPIAEPMAPSTPGPTATIPPKPAVMPFAGNIDVYGAKEPPNAAQIAQEMNGHDLEFQQDLARGHIKPETYQSLFAKKDTLGKIGTLFGMLISGAGSGLAHQPNAVMEMMNKQIQNDFDAQKLTNENAQNWLRLSQAHELQKAQIPLLEAQRNLAAAQATKVPSEIAEAQARVKEAAARAKDIEADAALKWSQHAKNRAQLGTIQSFQDQVDRVPPGPSKDNAQNGVNLMSKAVEGEIIDGNAKTAAQIEARGKIRASRAVDDTGVDMTKLNSLINQGKGNEALGAPALMSSSEAAAVTKEAGLVAKNRGLHRAWRDSFKKLSGDIAADKFNPEKRAAEVNVLATQIAHSTAHSYNPEEAHAQAEAMFPTMKDYGGAREEKLRKGDEFFKNEESETPGLDRFSLKKPFPESAGSQTKQSLKDGEKGKDRNGKPWTVIKGKRIYQ